MATRSTEEVFNFLTYQYRILNDCMLHFATGSHSYFMFLYEAKPIVEYIKKKSKMVLNAEQSLNLFREKRVT